MDMTNLHNRLRAVQGDIYDLDEAEYNAAVVFVKWGYNCLSADLIRNEERIAQSRIAYLVYSDSRMRMRYSHSFRPYLPMFRSQEDAEGYIRSMVHHSLDYAQRAGNRIAFHGVQIHGMDEVHNEKVTIEAVKEWLDRNQKASVTLVDKFGSFNRHFNE